MAKSNIINIRKRIREFFKSVWNYRRTLKLELFFFFYIMPTFCGVMTTTNFRLEKACHINLQYNREICSATLDKPSYRVDCRAFDFRNATRGPSSLDWNITVDSLAFNYTMCKADFDAQALVSDVTGNKSIALAISFVTLILFAGSWADRYNKRKLFLLLPIIGDLISFTCLLTSATFFGLLPLEFGTYIETYVPAICGGVVSVILSIFSYMALTTPEHNRVFRFGIFSIFASIFLTLGHSLSTPLFKYCGYIIVFSLGIIFHIIAILCVVYVVEDIESERKKKDTASRSPPQLPANSPPVLNTNGVDNLGYEATAISLHDLDDVPNTETANENTKLLKRSTIWELLDPSLINDFVYFPMTKRKNNGRMLLLLLTLAYFLTVGPVPGEYDCFNRYTLENLHWNGLNFSTYSTLTSGLGLLGTFIGVVILSKALGLKDSIIGLISALSVVFSRIVYAFAKDSNTFYIGGIVELFANLRVIAIKSIGSSIVNDDEISKMFAIFEVCEPISQLFIPFLFSEVYKRIVDNFPSAIFLFAEAFYIPNVIVFIVCYFIIRRNVAKKKDIENGEKRPELEPEAQEWGRYSEISSF